MILPNEQDSIRLIIILNHLNLNKHGFIQDVINMFGTKRRDLQFLFNEIE